MLIATFVLLGIGAWSQMSYEEFHARYTPHYNTIDGAKDIKAVEVVDDSDAETGALLCELLMQQADNGDEDAQLKILLILSSSKRQKVADILKTLTADRAVTLITYLKDEWIVELMWFVDKTTYHNLAPHLTAMKNYDGPTGPFGPEIGKGFAPAYAGAGYDMGFSAYKGWNNVIENYGDNSSPSAMSGFNVMVGFRTKGHSFLELMYHNRTAKTKYTDPSFINSRFNMHSIGINFMNGNFKKEGGLFAFTHGFGLLANIGSVQIDSMGTRTKLNGGFNGGISYQGQLFINPFKKVPVMFGLRGYLHMNIWPRFDYQGLYDRLNGNPAGTTIDNKDYQSVISTIGFQAQAMYKFGKKKDNREFKDFEAEVTDNIDPHVNTTYTEILPIVSPDGKTLYFIRSDHPQNYNGSMYSQDVWYADLSEGLENAEAHKMKTPLNNQNYNMIAGVSPDGNAMMIKGVFKNGASTGERGYSICYRTANGWGTPKKCDIKDYDNMSKGKYVGAYWTQDGKTIIMSFSESSTDSNQDLYASHIQIDGSWSRPKKLGSTINGDGDEHSPFLASDGKTLYFSSDREGSIGNNDIWMTQRQDDSWTNWSEPKNLGPEINTEEWDAYYSIDAQGKYAYMASGKNSKGREDIVRIKLKEEVQPDPVVLIRGKVLNKKTNEPLDASIGYNGLADGKNYGVARTNPANGEYTIVLPYGKNYDFTAGAEGYLGISDNLDLTGVGEYMEIERDLYLVPIEVGATVRLNNIFFETGKADLKKESFVELDRVVKFLSDNPNVHIELSGHTDNVGNKDFNKSLSQQRADAVLAYLTQKGIDTNRLVSKGYGMEKPVSTNDTDEGKALNRRVEFTILEH